jgi:hypothetical protein
MPSVWFWTTIGDLLTYGGTLALGAHAYCAAHAGTGVAAVLRLVDGWHVSVGCAG